MGQNNAGLVITENLKDFFTAAHYWQKSW